LNVNNDELFDIPAKNLFPEWVNQPIAVFDLETTGLDHRASRIVTACAALIDADGLIIGNDREWLANPGIEIPVEASNVHGITTEFARANGVELKTVVLEILETLGGYFRDGIPVVAYNAPYDFTILRNHAELFGLAWPKDLVPIIDPLVIDKKVDRYRSGKRRLEIVAAHYGVNLDDAHNATADAVAAGRIAQAIGRKFASTLPATAKELHEAQISWSEESDLSFAEFMRKSGKPDFVAQIGWPEKPLT
jgi:DNA polymerase-3 subunit epsilon